MVPYIIIRYNTQHNCDLQQQNDKNLVSGRYVKWNVTNAIKYNFNILRMINGAYIKM